MHTTCLDLTLDIKYTTITLFWLDINVVWYFYGSCLTRCALDTNRTLIPKGNKRHLVGETSHIVYTKHLPARGRSFTHQSLVREDVLSVRQIRYRTPIGEYVIGTFPNTLLPLDTRWPPLPPS